MPVTDNQPALPKDLPKNNPPLPPGQPLEMSHLMPNTCTTGLADLVSNLVSYLPVHNLLHKWVKKKVIPMIFMGSKLMHNIS